MTNEELLDFIINEITELQSEALPPENEFENVEIPVAAFARLINAHAKVMYEKNQKG